MLKWNFGCLHPSGERHPSLEDRFKTQGSVGVFAAVRMCSFIDLSKNWHFPRACWPPCDLKSSTQAHVLVSVIQVWSLKSLHGNRRNNIFQYLFSSSLTAACLADSEDRGGWLLLLFLENEADSYHLALKQGDLSPQNSFPNVNGRYQDNSTFKASSCPFGVIWHHIFDFFNFINYVGVQQNLAMGGFYSTT